MRKKTLRKKKTAQPGSVPRNPGSLLLRGHKPHLLPGVPLPLAPSLPGLGPKKPAAPALLLSATSTTTAQQQLVAEVGAYADKLLGQHARLKAIVEGLWVARQGYALLYNAMQEVLAQVPDCHPMVEDFLVQYASWMASKPFEEHAFMHQGLRDMLLPVLADVVAAHAQAEVEEARMQQAQRRTAEVQAETLRRAKTLPIGLRHTVQEAQPELARARTLVLVGWEPALLWLLDKMISTVRKATDYAHTIIAFGDVPPPLASADLIHVLPAHWRGCCNSAHELATVMGKYVAPKLTRPPDLVVCVDLSEALTRTLVGRPAAAIAGDAHKILRKWCDGTGAGLVALLPQGGKILPDLDGHEFAQLRTFTWLRPVHLLVDAPEGHYRVALGNDHAAVYDVPRAEIDAYARARLQE